MIFTTPTCPPIFSHRETFLVASQSGLFRDREPVMLRFHKDIYVQLTLDNWNPQIRSSQQIVQIMKTKMCTKHKGMERKSSFSNRSNNQSVRIIRVPIIEGRLYIIRRIQVFYYNMAPRNIICINIFMKHQLHGPSKQAEFGRIQPIPKF